MNDIVVEKFYKDYSPSFDPEPLIRRMLAEVPEVYLSGLEKIVLTTASKRSRKERRRRIRRRGRVMTGEEALGLYYRPWQGRQAYIELNIDKLEEQIKPVRRIPLVGSFVRHLLIASTLYHEIGHHIHRTKRLEFREPENIADRYSGYYTVKYLRGKFWYVPIIALIPFWRIHCFNLSS